jgi:hypothetical protein
VTRYDFPEFSRAVDQTFSSTSSHLINCFRSCRGNGHTASDAVFWNRIHIEWLPDPMRSILWSMTNPSENHPKTSFLRRKYLVVPQVQIALLLHSSLSCLIGILVTHTFYRLSDPELGSPPISLEWAYAICLFSGVAVLLVLTYGGIMLTNRYIGPLFRLRDHMMKVAEGQAPDPIQYRKRDFFPELAEAYNLLLKRIR